MKTREAETAGDLALDVQDLRTYFYTEEGEIRAVDGASFQLMKARTLAIVGESGCGKSVTAFSLLRLIERPGEIVSGSICLHHESKHPTEVLDLPKDSDELFNLRGGQISMIFQDALAALSPVHTIGNQLLESLLTHRKMPLHAARSRVLTMVEKVGLSDPELRLRQYPHELSGGMRQRVMIAMAILTSPQVLIADEPTTALDVTVQKQILSLIKELQLEHQTAVLLITHDLGVVAHSADDVLVMYLGKVVERGNVKTLLKKPRHPYTMGLLASLPTSTPHKMRLPSIEGSVPALSDIPDGCSFHPRCPYQKRGVCDTGPAPALSSLSPGHEAACHRLDDVPHELAEATLRSSSSPEKTN